jgi:hypothetical protein
VARVSKTGLHRKPLTPAHKAAISASLKGKAHPHKGHAISPETRAKISAKLKGRHYTR